MSWVIRLEGFAKQGPQNYSKDDQGSEWDGIDFCICNQLCSAVSLAKGLSRLKKVKYVDVSLYHKQSNWPWMACPALHPVQFARWLPWEWTWLGNPNMFGEHCGLQMGVFLLTLSRKLAKTQTSEVEQLNSDSIIWEIRRRAKGHVFTEIWLLLVRSSCKLRPMIGPVWCSPIQLRLFSIWQVRSSNNL